MCSVSRAGAFVWLALLLFAACQLAATAEAAADAVGPSLQGIPPPGVVDVTSYKPAFERAATEADLTELFRDNLDPDLAPFKAAGPLNIGKFAAFVRSFNFAVPAHPLGEGNVALVVVRNGSVSTHWVRGKDAHYRMACIKTAIEGAKSLRFPDTAFVLNIDDFHICTGGRCPLPVFTNYKKWRAGRNLESNEVLFPVMNHHYDDLYSFPWHKKRPAAFMRASQQGCMPINSSRVQLAVMSEQYPDMLDLGITRIDGADKHVLKYQFGKASFVTIEDHAKWKYSVSADGCVGQTRLAKVLMSDSVVIKEESDWIEYYYRSLKPWKHYVPFGSDHAGPKNLSAGEQVLALVATLRQQDTRAQLIATTAQRWAYKHLGQFPRLLYIRKQLVEYNKLWGGAMEAWVADRGPELLFSNPLAAESLINNNGSSSGGGGGIEASSDGASSSSQDARHKRKQQPADGRRFRPGSTVRRRMR